MDLLKQLTGKNPKDFEYAAKYVMDNADEKLFAELVEKDSFLFDFVKQNVAQRLAKATNDNNWKSVLCFLKYYSPSYEDFICSTLAKYADEDLTDEILTIFETGTDEAKTYCANYFKKIPDTVAKSELIKTLKSYTFSDNIMFETKVQSNWVGHSLKELNLRNKFSLNIIVSISLR